MADDCVLDPSVLSESERTEIDRFTKMCIHERSQTIISSSSQGQFYIDMNKILNSCEPELEFSRSLSDIELHLSLIHI